MLRQRDDVAALLARDAVENAAPHPGAIGAVGIGILGQRLLRFFKDGLRFEEIGYTEPGQIGFQR
jgi:hypothetical protein